MKKISDVDTFLKPACRQREYTGSLPLRREKQFVLLEGALVLGGGLSFACNTSATSSSVDFQHMIFTVVVPCTGLLLAKELISQQKNCRSGLCLWNLLVICAPSHKSTWLNKMSEWSSDEAVRVQVER